MRTHPRCYRLVFFQNFTVLTKKTPKLWTNFILTVLNPNKIATFLPVDGYTITMYNSGNKGEKENV